ncbi:hypothetical protein FRC08_007267 [Ceratobasidium sp. 394]|nr:hypothetical protein FRC08_007267 [Ceratobasidium sp. 394]KAG9098309.1 hypothetical protein FS749_004119 [Ceratobasidium sp. UAMH 11750]
MSLRAPVDAVALAARIRDELPSGTAQHFAAMVILNNLMSYSERYGLLLEHEDRAVVTSLSVEFLYLAWHYGVEIKLNQSHAKYWPLQIWKDSASLGINLKELVDIRESIDHDKLRNARTLLSFGAVVNQYFGIIRAQPNGLETFKNSYCPVVPGLSPVLPLPPNTPTLQPKPTKLGWSWANLWGRSGSRSPGLKPPSPAIEPLLIPGSMPPPPVDLLPFSTEDTTFFPLRMESIPSASTEASSSLFPDSASSWTTESVPDSTVSAMDRLEAYLSVIGTPDCENVGYIPIRKKPLAPLEEAEQAIGKHRLFEPVRRTREELGHGPVIAQKDPLSWTSSKPCGVRWMAAEELKVRQDKIEAQKMQQRAKELKKIKWKGAKSAQLMPRRAAVVQFQPRGTGNSPLAHEVKGEPEIIHINCD